MDKRMSISLSSELDDAVETYRFENRDRLPTKNKAINELIKLGIEELEAEIETKNARKYKAPTADDAAEALYELLYYYLGKPPTSKQIEALKPIISVLCDSIDGLDRSED